MAFGSRLERVTGWLFLSVIPVGLPAALQIAAGFGQAMFGWHSWQLLLAELGTLALVWYDGSPKLSMHNWYTQLYNQAVFEAIEETSSDLLGGHHAEQVAVFGEVFEGTTGEVAAFESDIVIDSIDRKSTRLNSSH